jgi:uncharacterized SAM-binding protein YcdF (DUF218 family)
MIHARIRALRLGLPVFISGVILYSAAGILYDGRMGDPVKADAAVVLGAASWGADPSPVFRERINHAIRLYRSGLAGKIIFTGGPDSGDEAPGAVVARGYALKRGVPERDILVEGISATTEENLRFARQLAREKNLGTFLIVSDPLHIRRAMMMAEDLGMKAYRAPTPTTRYRSFRNRSAFLAREIYFCWVYRLRRLVSAAAGA